MNDWRQTAGATCVAAFTSVNEQARSRLGSPAAPSSPKIRPSSGGTLWSVRHAKLVWKIKGVMSLTSNQSVRGALLGVFASVGFIFVAIATVNLMKCDLS